MLIDTHCHLNFKYFQDKLDKTVAEAKAAGVEKIIIPGSDLQNSQLAIEIAQKYEGIFAAVGVHPHHAGNLNASLDPSNSLGMTDVQKKLLELGKQDKVVAIGETGLDYYEYQVTKYPDNKITPEVKKLQKQLFQIQLEVAHELGLPVIIHNREAHGDMLTQITNDKLQMTNLKGVFHCYTGDQEFLEKILKMGFYAGIDGNVTYSKTVLKNAKKISLERLLLETDSPFLSPKPYRNEKNSPKNVKIIAQYLSRKLKIPLEKISQQTTNNAEQLFKI
jgi:TatD DNase family protein